MVKQLYKVEKNVPLPASGVSSELVKFLHSLKEGDSYVAENNCKATYHCTKMRKLGGKAIARAKDQGKVKGPYRVWIIKALDSRRKGCLVGSLPSYSKYPKMVEVWDMISKDQKISVDTAKPDYRQGVIHCNMAIKKLLYPGNGNKAAEKKKK